MAAREARPGELWSSKDSLWKSQTGPWLAGWLGTRDVSFHRNLLKPKLDHDLLLKTFLCLPLPAEIKIQGTDLSLTSQLSPWRSQLEPPGLLCVPECAFDSHFKPIALATPSAGIPFPQMATWSSSSFRASLKITFAVTPSLTTFYKISAGSCHPSSPLLFFYCGKIHIP